MNHSTKNFTRNVQLDKQLAKEIAELLPKYFPAKKFGMLSVVWVQTAKGFDSVKVSVSVMKNSHQFDDVAKTVIHKIQADLNHKLVMKKIPKIILELDRTTDLIKKIERLEK